MHWITYDNHPGLRNPSNPIVQRVPRERQEFFLGEDFEDWCANALLEGVQYRWEGLELDLYFAEPGDHALLIVKWNQYLP